ncbi:CDC48 family AAA ATPase [Halobacteriales archaeon Cl-PHB]
MTDGSAGLAVRVEGARKRDAGRGIARLPQAVQNRLGVLSGDPVLVEGDDITVAKVWPGDGEGDVVRIDADTRADAGTTIGDTVTIRRASVGDAIAVTLQPADESAETTAASATVRNRLVDRILRPGKRVRLQGLGTFVVTATEPTGSVRVTDDTEVGVDADVADPDAVSGPSGTAAGSPTDAPDAGATTYEDIGGLDDELDLVREMVELPLAEPDLFGRLGIDPPTGVLLHGPPGTGKTLIARAVANEVDAYFDTISGPEIVSKYKGESEERLREAFERAADNAPSILFVDEIDSIAGTRDEDADMENRVVAQLLTLMDGLEERDRVVVVGATNRIDAVDPALRRGGRFDREIEVGVPDETGRREILDVHTRNVPLADDVDLDRVAARTHGFVGADLATLVREAAMVALRRHRDERAAEAAADDGAETADQASTETGALALDRAAFEAAMAAVEPSAMREYVSESPTVRFEDVGGLADAKDRLREAVQWPLEYGPLFDAARTDPPSGVLLHGPPGTGKTLLARAIAGESGVNFVRVAGPEILDRYVGESEAAIREVFDRARQTAPAIVFLDEIDAIAGRRGESHEVTERVVSQLLTELDTSAENPQLLVVAATNRKDALDPALLRPGRLERHVHVPEPGGAARQAILEVHTADKPLAADVDLGTLAARTDGYSGADLAALVRSASMRAIRDVANEVEPAAAAEHADEVVVGLDHFEAALEEGETQ